MRNEEKRYKNYTVIYYMAVWSVLFQNNTTIANKDEILDVKQ